MKSDPKKMLEKHPGLVHSEGMKVLSHVQRVKGDWLLNTLMIEGWDVPFQYKRRKKYKSLAGGYVNLTYYPETIAVAGIDMEIMKVVRVRRA